jgi:hypothetical protein
MPEYSSGILLVGVETVGREREQLRSGNGDVRYSKCRNAWLVGSLGG